MSEQYDPMREAIAKVADQQRASEQATLERRLGDLDSVVRALSGFGGEAIGAGPDPAGWVQGSTPKVGQGNQLTEPMLDTVEQQTIGTSESSVSFDLYGSYSKASGTAPTVRDVAVVPFGGGSSMASSMAGLRISGASSSGNITVSLYTKSAIVIGTNTADLPYIVAACRLFRFASPNNSTNVTTWTGTVELVKNIAGTPVVVDSRAIDLTLLDALEDIRLWASATAPFTAGDTYDLRVKIAFVTTGSASTDLRVGIGEPSLELSYTPDPTPYIPDRTPGRFDFGNGADGDVTIASGTTTLTSDKVYRNLTIASGATLKTASYKVFVRNRLINAGTISNDGATGSASTGSVAGNGASAVAAGSLAASGAGGDGKGGRAGTAGGSLSSAAIGGNGGAGGKDSGDANAGLSGGTTTYSASNGIYQDSSLLKGGATPAGTLLQPGAGGGGGGGTAGAGTYGGGGGSGGGMVVIAARYLDNSAGTIRANGGTGGAGTAGNGGGGGGGGGGAVLLVYETLLRGTEQANGGSPGASSGTAGQSGLSGAVVYVRG